MQQEYGVKDKIGCYYYNSSMSNMTGVPKRDGTSEHHLCTWDKQ